MVFCSHPWGGICVYGFTVDLCGQRVASAGPSSLLPKATAHPDPHPPTHVPGAVNGVLRFFEAKTKKAKGRCWCLRYTLNWPWTVHPPFGTPLLLQIETPPPSHQPGPAHRTFLRHVMYSRIALGRSASYLFGILRCVATICRALIFSPTLQVYHPSRPRTLFLLKRPSLSYLRSSFIRKIVSCAFFVR